MSEELFNPAVPVPGQGALPGDGPGVPPEPRPRPEPATPEPAVSSQPGSSAPGVTSAQTEEAQRLGETLAFAIRQGKYHPVVVFGTTSSGKTSLLLSLFAAIRTEGHLQAALSLCDPLLGKDDTLSRQLHDEARHTFENKTEQFIRGQRPAANAFAQPFFIPVKFEPGEGKPPVRFAILEGKGEWYAANEEAIGSAQSDARIHPELKGTLERFIGSYEGPITFLYLAPYTQRQPTGDLHSKRDSGQIKLAALGISGMIDSYRRVRGVHAHQDWHQLIVTKWDEHSAAAEHPDDVAQDDQGEAESFLLEYYGEPFNKWTKFPKSRRRMKAYTAGITNEEGIVLFSRGHSLRETLRSYPVGLWTRLYRNALEAANEPDTSPFPQPPAPSPFRIAINRILRVFTGH